MTKHLTRNARALRAQMTDAEQLIWQAIRLMQMGVKFRHQAPSGARGI